MVLTNHATFRGRQRRISSAAVQAALRWGSRSPVANGRFRYFLGRREVAEAIRQGAKVGAFLGVVVIATWDLVVVTDYKAAPWEV